MERKYAQRLKKSFQQTKLDTPVPKLSYSKKSKRIKALPPPLEPTKYVAPAPQQPKPKPRTQKSKRPVPLPRSIPKPIDDGGVCKSPLSAKVQKIIDVITPYYRPDAIRKFERELKDKKNLLDIQDRIEEKAKALKNYAKTYEVDIISKKDADVQLNFTKIDVSRVFVENLLQKKGIKVQIHLKILMKKSKIEDGEETFIYQVPDFNSKYFIIYYSDTIAESLDKAFEEINNGIAKWLSEGSGWVIEKIEEHNENIVEFLPLRGSSYIELPVELRNSKKGLINLKNKDNKCAIWCIVRHLNPQKKNPQRIKISDEEFIKKLDLKGITFPVTIKQFDQIENQNKININVFSYDNIERELRPIRIAKEKYEDHVELLYIEEEKENRVSGHYVLFKNSLIIHEPNSLSKHR